MQKGNKTCFISYSHEGTDRDALDYFIHVMKDLLGTGAQVFYDQNLRFGGDFNRFMELLDTVDVVITILSPSYKRRVLDRDGGVYEEFRRIWERYSGQGLGSENPENGSHFEVIPILLSGTRENSTPSELVMLKQLDLTNLRVTRKPSGEFHIPHQARRAFFPQFQALASQIHAAATVESESFTKLSKSYYDRLFVDLKANFNEPVFAGQNYIDTILVKTHSYLRVESQLAYFVVGRKGSGKSTLTQVLPLVHPDRYESVVNIVADDFNLESLYGLYSSDQQFRSDVNVAIPRDRAFEFTWEALLILATMDVILSGAPALTSAQQHLASSMNDFLGRMKGTNSQWNAGDLFNYAFNATIAFVKHCIDEARSDPAVFLADIGVRFNRQHYLESVFGSEIVDCFRKLISTFNRRFLITMDGFDNAFDKFRVNSTATDDNQLIQRRVNFEIDWLRSLLGLVITAKTKSQDYFFGSLDFCIAAPKDRFMEITRIERDSYRHWQRWCTLSWSGIELAILLRKRLEVLADHKTKKDMSPRDRLENVLHHRAFRHIPVDIEFDYNGKSYKMPLFTYILRHTFWRPREILIYYADLLALGEDMKRWNYEVTTDAIRKCVKNAAKRIIESEFLTEFQSTVMNIREIVRAFKKRPTILSFDLLRQILMTLDFKFASGNIAAIDVVEKIQFLYEIGFLGVKADKQLMEEFGLHLEDAFCFNEGTSLLVGADEDDLRHWRFTIHPIFSEYLRLDRKGQDLMLQFEWDYLQVGDALFSANPDV